MPARKQTLGDPPPVEKFTDYKLNQLAREWSQLELERRIAALPQWEAFYLREKSPPKRSKKPRAA